MRKKKKKEVARVKLPSEKKIKKKNKRDEPLNPRMVSKRKANAIVWVLVLILPTLVLIGTIRTFGVLGQLSDLQVRVETMRVSERNETNGADVLDITLVTHVLDVFVPMFMDLDMSNRQAIERRSSELSNFANFDVGAITVGTDSDLRRTLFYYDLISVRSSGTHFLASYRVEYRIQGQEHSLLGGGVTAVVLNIPFVVEGGVVTIVSMPYFTANLQMVSGEADFDFSIVSDTSLEMRERRDSISSFLPTFFEMYARSDEAELSLFMSEPILMGGRFNLASVDVLNARFRAVGQNVMVQVSVTFYDIGTEFFHTVPFTLIMEQQTNSWFILEMYHLFID